MSDPMNTTDPVASTRERRDVAMTIVNTGDGKGKTTAACGVALRAWAHGLDIGVYQFIKSGKWHVGEETALRALGEQTGTVTWEHMGTGWTWTRRNQVAEALAASTKEKPSAQESARAGWEHLKELLATQRHDLYILDEFTYVMDNGWVETAEVVDVLTHRPGKQHVIITGRRCPQAVLDLANLATEMRKIKHPFDHGQRGQAGIEW